MQGSIIIAIIVAESWQQMALPKKPKDCIDMRMCISAEAAEAIKKHQSKVHLEKGLWLKRHEAASDLFEMLLKGK